VHEFKNSAETDISQACHNTNKGGYKDHAGVFTRKKKFPEFERVHNFSGMVQP
jgi:hypothetical protein